MGSDKVYILIVLYGAKLNSCFCARIVKFGGETKNPTFQPILCKFMFLKERGIQYHALLFVFLWYGNKRTGHEDGSTLFSDLI